MSDLVSRLEIETFLRMNHFCLTGWQGYSKRPALHVRKTLLHEIETIWNPLLASFWRRPINHATKDANINQIDSFNRSSTDRGNQFLFDICTSF